MKSYRPTSLREELSAAPDELDVQALWFEQLHAPILRTDDGRRVEIVQPGFWNHAAGPDFQRAAVRFLDDKDPARIEVGEIEVHLRPGDWNAHGHHADPAYDRTLLHVVWSAPGNRPFFPATASFRRVPQIVLGSQLVAPWPELRPLCATLRRGPLPAAVPGRCSPLLAAQPPEQIAAILRAAGRYRLRQKTRRWFWRRHLVGVEQALFEGLAEALGFHANQVPMRLVAQRLPWKKLRALSAPARLAHLFGLAGFLPEESAARLQRETRVWLRELWEIWWKARGPLDFALLPKSQWRLAGLRPLNRPERRLAALAQIVPRLPELVAALSVRDDERFAQLLLGVRDPFWEKHATLSGAPLAAPCRLIGDERVRDILVNLFWPLVALDDEGAAEKALAELRTAPNNSAKIATQRTLLDALPIRLRGEALINVLFRITFGPGLAGDDSRFPPRGARRLPWQRRPEVGAYHGMHGVAESGSPLPGCGDCFAYG
jgi:hypothetical protein